jgi:4-amino-4-deoxy-L-arabinose transferase-like glycosyltransferase
LRLHLAIISALALMLAAQAGWSAATTSGTYDETTYQNFGHALYGEHDAKGLAGWGVAPLPVLLTQAPPALAGSPSYPQAITLARISAIVLFAVPLVVIVYWTLLHAFGMGAAITGTAFLSLSPNIVAHAALSTTDVAFMAAALAALAALVHCIETPSGRSRALLGVSLAVALAAKYSALGLFVVAALALLATSGRRSKSYVRGAVDSLALVTSLFVVALIFVWVLHGFAMVPFGLPPIEDMSLPASIVGIARQIHHQSLGEPAFLMGLHSTMGWWYYVPVALAVKSTPAELVVDAMALVALVSVWRKPTPSGLVWRLAFVVFAAAGIVNHIAFGIRYVLVLIPLATFLAAEWLVGTGTNGRRSLIVVASALVAIQLVSAVSIAPHYLSYFNWFAGGPEKGYTRLADSNVDWGQDLPALKTELARLGAKHPLLSYFGTAPPEAYGVQADRWDGSVQDKFERWDWVAISDTNLDGVFLGRDPFADFRAMTPGGRAGYSILLYPTSREDVRRAMATAAIRLR